MGRINYVFFADGFEEIEALTIVDVMRRGGMDVRTVSVMPLSTVIGAHGVPVACDITLDEVSGDIEWLVLPGGMPGATNLVNNEGLTAKLRAHASQGGLTAAICASPSVVLAALGLLEGRRATCYPSMELEGKGVQWCSDMVVADGNIITGRGPAAAAEFALAIVAKSCGDEVANGVANGMLIN